MNFTPELPTKPGAYLVKLTQDSEFPLVASVHPGSAGLNASFAMFNGDPVSSFKAYWSAPLEPVKPKCIWTKRPHDTLFKTACGVHKFLDPGSNEPASNFYCPNCGGRMEIKL
jgi:hypothetical protein